MLHVTCALIESDHKILVCQRSSSMSLPLKWEFPGGKIEANESKQECLKREIFEELAIHIKVGKELTSVEYHYANFSICLSPFMCSITSGQVQLREHKDFRWVAKSELLIYDWAEADVPVVKEYLSLH